MFGRGTVCIPLPPTFVLFDDDVTYTRDRIIDMIHLPREAAEGRCESLPGFRYMAPRESGIKAKLETRLARFLPAHGQCSHLQIGNESDSRCQLRSLKEYLFL